MRHITMQFERKDFKDYIYDGFDTEDDIPNEKS